MSDSTNTITIIDELARLTIELARLTIYILDGKKLNYNIQARLEDKRSSVIDAPIPIQHLQKNQVPRNRKLLILRISMDYSSILFFVVDGWSHGRVPFEDLIQFVNSNLKRPLGRLIFFIHVLCHNLAVLCTIQDLERLL